MIDALKNGQRKIRQHFGAAVAARLVFEPDPEISGYQPIVVEIRTPATMKDSFDRMQRFEEEWWLDASEHVAADICFLVVPPMNFDWTNYTVLADELRAR